jgi:hypothetical protein
MTKLGCNHGESPEITPCAFHALKEKVFTLRAFAGVYILRREPYKGLWVPPASLHGQPAQPHTSCTAVGAAFTHFIILTIYIITVVVHSD